MSRKPVKGARGSKSATARRVMDGLGNSMVMARDSRQVGHTTATLALEKIRAAAALRSTST